MAGKPKPTALKVLEGNPGKRPLNENEPKPKVKKPKAVELDRDARKIFKELAPKLVHYQLLTEIDGQLFSALCQTAARLVQIRREMNKPDFKLLQMKHTIDAAGNEFLEGKENPLVRMEINVTDTLRKLCAHFCLSVKDRAAIVLQLNKQQSALEVMLD